MTQANQPPGTLDISDDILPAQIADDPNPAQEQPRDESGRFTAKPDDAAPGQPERQESKREAIARGIRERRSEPAETENKAEDLDTDQVPDLALAEAATASEAIETEAEPEPQPKKRQIKVDGKTIEVSEDDLVRIAQQNFAADRRLDEAKRAREEAARDRAEAARLLELSRQGDRANPPAAMVEEPQPDTAALTRQRLSQLREQLMFGSEEEGITALEEFQRMTAPTQTREEPDVHAVVEQALADQRRKETSDRTLAQFAQKNPDLVSDRKARLLVEDGLIEEMQRDMLAFPDVSEDDVNRLTPMQVAEAHKGLREQGFQVRPLDALMEAAAASARSVLGRSIQPQPEQRAAQPREDRKRSTTPQPRSAGIRVDIGAQPQAQRSRSDVIREMSGRTRGTPVPARN